MRSSRGKCGSTGQDEAKYAAFLTATHGGNTTAIQWLQNAISEGVNLTNVRNPVTIVTHTLSHSRPPCLQLGNNVLHHACYGGLFETVKFCVEHGVNPLALNQVDATPTKSAAH